MNDIIVENITTHDLSITFLWKNKLFYLKLERFYQIKHFGFKNVKGFQKLNMIDNNKTIKQLFYKKYVYDVLKKINPNFINYKINYDDYSHHLRHALSIDFFEEKPCDVHVVIDGQGGRVWWSIYRNNTLVDSGDIFDTGGSLGHGLAYAGLESRIFSKKDDPLDIPGKYMGLQSYGKINEEHYQNLLKYNMNYIGEKEVTSDVSFLMNKNHMFVIDRNVSYKEKIDILHTIHKRAGEIVLSIFEKYVLPHEKIGYSGGVAQNVIWNTMLKKRYHNLVIYPHCGDEGISIGNAQVLNKNKKLTLKNYPYCQFDQAPETTPSIDTIQKTAKFLANGKIVAWYQGHGEVGPRALGNRSILMDPRIPNGKDVINRVKNREHYRPFGSSVLSEYAKEYFDLDFPNPYMLYLGYTQKSNLNAITHVDGTSRAQTVDSSCGYFRVLLEHFFELTGCPVLLNTSLNEAGKPIAGWIKNAENIFASSLIDVLIVGDNIYEK